MLITVTQVLRAVLLKVWSLEAGLLFSPQEMKLKIKKVCSEMFRGIWQNHFLPVEPNDIPSCFSRVRLFVKNYVAATIPAKSHQSCPALRPHRQPPTRLPRPWDSSGKNTGVGCYFLLQCIRVKSEREVTQSCPTLSQYFFVVCFLLKPFLVELLTFTIKRMLTNIPFQFCYTKKGA